jgi:hypothetical protein
MRRASLITLALAGCTSAELGKLALDRQSDRGVDQSGASAERRSDRRGAASGWAVSAGPNAAGNAIGVDVAGNAYVGGGFLGQVTLGSKTLNTGSADRSPLVARLDAQGTFVWATKGDGVGEVIDLAVDAAGNSHLVGWFKDSITFGSTTLAASTPDHGLFVVKLAPDGQVLWAVAPKADLRTYGGAITVDSTGNVYVAGSLVGSASFGSIDVVAAAGAIFVAKLSPEGGFLWVTLAPQSPPAEYTNEPRAIAVDADGNSFITGRYNTTVTWGSKTLSHTGPGDNLFLTRLDPAGKPLWAISGSADTAAWGTGLALDGKGHGYLGGGATGGTCWQPPCEALLTINGATAAGADNDVFLARFATSDGAVEWIVVPGGTSSYPAGPVVDGQGHVFLAGAAAGTTFGSTTLPNGPFLARVDEAGSFTWATVATGGSIYALASDRAGSLLATGRFGSPITMGDTRLTPVKPNWGIDDLFVWKVTP